MSRLATSSLGCPDEESLYRYAAGKLGEARSRELSAHLEGCSMCSKALASRGDTSRRGDADDAHDDDPRSLVDERYRVAEVLGRGASATVYRADDTRLGEEVALKVFRKGLGEKVAQEVLIARRVSHPNVCRVYDAGVSEGVAYLSMELVRGDTLAKRLADLGAKPDPEAEAIVRAILAGLGAAHDAGVVHRDLKPQNILVEPSGRVVITDFGLARLEGEEESRARIIGTPATWSPEQARGEPATPASDVYSFGVVAYRLLTGRSFRVSDAAPFEGVPKRWRPMLVRSLALSPRDRAANAAEVVALLARGGAPPWRSLVAVLVVLAGVAIGASISMRSSHDPHAKPDPAEASSGPAAPVLPASAPKAALEPAAPAASSPHASPAPSVSASDTKHAHPSHSAKVAPSAPRPGPAAPEGPDLLFGK